MQRNEKPLDRSASTTTTWDIPKIVSQAMSGKLRVPTFQRSFVWDPKDVLRLFDSLYRGFPVGTLLLWQQPLKPGTSRFGPIEFDVPEDPEGLWIVDGQQRVTSLVASLSPIEHRHDERFDVFFDLSRKRFVGPLRGMRPPRSIPIREALESRRLLAWLRAHGDDLEDADLETADGLGGALRDYKIPAYIVEENDESLLREVFDRVNSAGKPISRAQVFHALFAQGAEEGSPATVVEELRSRGFGRLDEGKVVQSLLAIRGGDVQRDIHDEFDEGDELADWYDRTERALSRVFSFLNTQGAPHLLLLPSTFPIPVLAAFFDLHPEPDEWILELLGRWLWRGWVHGFGREAGQTPALRKAIQVVNPKKGRPELAPDPFTAAKRLLDNVGDSELTNLNLDSFMTARGNGRLFLLALNALGPLDPAGQAIDVPQVLESRGTSAIGQLVPGPRSLVANRAFWLPEWPKLTGAESREILKSHNISSAAASELRQFNPDGFLAQRERDILESTLSFLNSKMDIGLPARPPLSNLMVSDPETVPNDDE
ncbi:hypothetical protein GCM10009825_28870 [Arthrobacter humicola]|uniref:GmrSD restriction endonucleases N-terminal domain-containing protein n=1 Tax=Arthrobacter humicola TaxID=409291 RepID=A0ABN2ZE53_9MICC